MTSLQIIYLKDSTTFDQVANDLIGSNNIGLSLIHDNKENIIAICLTSKSAIYVISPDQTSQINLLKSLLSRNELRFYTANGLWDSQLLKSNFGIHLKNKIDLTAFHIQLTIMLHVQTKKCIDQDIDQKYILEKIRPEFMTYDQLVAKYRLSNSRAFNYNCDEMGKLIQRKSMYVRDLAIKMEAEYYQLTHNPSQTIYSLALCADNANRIRYDNSKNDSFNELCYRLANLIKLENHI